MARVFILVFVLFVLASAAAISGELDLLALHAGDNGTNKPRMNKFILVATEEVPAAPLAGKAPYTAPPPVAVSMPSSAEGFRFLTWKNVCARSIGIDAGLKIPDECPDDFATMTPYLGRRKDVGGGMFGYFLPKW